MSTRTETRRWRVFRALDRRGLRRLIGPARSLDILLRYRELCAVTQDPGGGWRLRARGSVMVGPTPNLLPPRRLRERTLDAFCHGFRPGPGDTVLDIGAGIGREGFVFADLVGPEGAVHCVEAHPRTFEFLVRMRELNGLANVHCHHLAIGETSGAVAISTQTEPGLYYRNRIGGGDDDESVRLGTVGELVDEQRIDSVDLLAMNIEGAERGAVVGMAPVVERIRNVVIACHDFLAEQTGDGSMRTKQDVRQLLEAHGFRHWSRAEEARPWLRDFVYGSRTA